VVIKQSEMIDYRRCWKPWQEELAKKHGLTCPPGWYGFACREGWKDLLDRAFTKLRAAGWVGEIHQVKEKFGTLRLYVAQDGRPDFDAIIRDAEDESCHTCEDCGAPGETTRNLPWIQTLCRPCLDKAYAELAKREEEWAKRGL